MESLCLDVKCHFCSADAFKYKVEEKWMLLCHSCQRNVLWSKIEYKESSTNKDNFQINYSSLLQFSTKIKDLPEDHFCRRYVQGRGLLSEQTRDYVLENLYFTDKMSVFAKATDYELKDGQPKLIIPFFDEEGKMFGLQARALDKSSPRYLTMIFDKNKDKLFGMDRVNTNEQFFCVEGPIDSLFVRNCIAMAGSDGLDNKYKDKAVVVFDNEPRNKQTVSKMGKYLSLGYKVVIWPSSLKEKDINEMVNTGVDVDSVLKHNIFSGLTGKIKLNNWKRVNEY